MSEESIYNFINRMSVEHPGLPYVFQDQYNAGRIDAHYALWESELSFSIKERLARELVEHMVTCVEAGAVTKELSLMLAEEPIGQYLSSLNSRMKLYLSEGLVDEGKFYSFGMELATESKKEEEVKLGMLIIGFFENDFTRQILKTLGLHSSFTLYALEASKNFACHNKFVYELAKGTLGFGKLVALYLLKPIQQRQREWVFAKGMRYSIIAGMTAIICLEKMDMTAFYKDLILNEDNFSNLSYLLAYASEHNNIKEFSQGLILVEKYLEVAHIYAKTFIDLAALVMIERNMAPNWIEHDADIEYENGWSSDIEETITGTCKEIIEQARWKNVALYELNTPREQTSIITSTLERLEMLPNFGNFISLLERDLFDMNILEYLLIDHPEYYWLDVFGYLFYILPEGVLDEGPQETLDEDITFDHRPDIWLVYLLRAMIREGENQEDFFIHCLSARLPDVRIEAIHALRLFKQEWSKDVLPALESAYEIEPVEVIERQLSHLMNEDNDAKDKEQRYVDISGTIAKPSPFDIGILNTNIAGTAYRDLTVVEGQMESGDILLLVREPDNKYDRRAIIVTDEHGYALGYIPRVDNEVPAAMMDAGEQLYAILLSDDLEEWSPYIQVVLNKRPTQRGKIVQFPD